MKKDRLPRILPSLLALLLLAAALPVRAQIIEGFETPQLNEQLEQLAREPAKKPAKLRIDEDSIVRAIDRMPSFGLFRDNYFITGVPTNRRITKSTADIKFQISIRQRLTQSVLPWKTFLFLSYTQKTFWNIYEKSSPIIDFNLNPGISLAKNVVHDGKLIGLAILSVEHESNGKGGADSRSWNYVGLSYSYFFNLRFSVQGKVFIPFFLDKEYTPNFPRYRGFALVALTYQSPSRRFSTSAVFNLRKRFGDANVTLEANVKINKKANQYMFVQYYTGYAENQIDYKRYQSMIRIGFNIKPNYGNIF